MRIMTPAGMFIFCLMLLPVQAQESGTMAVISGEVTRDHRPLLWKNRESGVRENEVAFFHGPRYDFFGIIDRNDTARVWMGLNTAGFALVHTEVLGQASSTTAQNGLFIKQALGRCGRVDDLEELLAAYADSSSACCANFAGLDAFGSTALFEVNLRRLARLTPSDSTLGAPGVLVRTDFVLTGPGGSRGGSWRYQRARELLQIRAQSRELDVPFVLQSVARDLASEEVDPYPLPFMGKVEDAPQGYVPTRTTLNNYRTVSCAVIQGVRPGEDPRLSTLWVILGEPVSGIALPLWPSSGEMPAAYDGKDGSDLNQTLLRNRERFYPKKSWPQHIDTSALLRGRRSWLTFMTEFENDVFSTTASALQKWRRSRPDTREMAQLQYQFARSLLRAL